MLRGLSSCSLISVVDGLVFGDWPQRDATYALEGVAFKGVTQVEIRIRTIKCDFLQSELAGLLYLFGVFQKRQNQL